MSDNFIKVEKLFAGYNGVEVIRNINLEAGSGEFLCIAGPNGSGKSTLLRAMARLLPCRGSITIDNRNIAAFTRKDLAKKIAMLGQTSQFYFPYTVYDTVALGRYAHGKGFLPNLRAQDRRIINETLERLELEDLRETSITELSGGQLQRVFLARTIVQSPELILLDEPTNHLDLKYQIELLRYLCTWAQEQGGIVIAVLHDLNLARNFARRMILLNKGEIAMAGSTGDLLGSAGQHTLETAYGMDIRSFMQESLARWSGALSSPLGTINPRG
jgi:iron complex transport system ATP-binding protein